MSDLDIDINNEIEEDDEEEEEQGHEQNEEMTLLSPFSHPISYEDKRWKWRSYLQIKLNDMKHQHYILKILQNANMKNRNDNVNNDISIIYKQKHLLKYGCPLHDLKQSLLQHNYQCPSVSLCNGYSNECNMFSLSKNDKSNNNKNDHIEYNPIMSSFVQCGEWSFSQLAITKYNISRLNTPLFIKVFNKKDNKLIHEIPFDILRTSETTFPKRFRPGFYNYNGKPRKTKANKLQNNNVTDDNNNDNKIKKKKEVIAMEIL